MKENFNFPFFVAEISANHNGNFNSAKRLIKLAKTNGADAVKLQTYSPMTMTIRSSKKYFKINTGIWKGENLWNLYDKAQTPYRWHKKLFDYAKKIGILCFSTPFDETAVDFLETLKCPIYKISSFEMMDFPLIKKISKTKKPLIISTGMAKLSEIEQSYNFARKMGIKNLALLYCVSNYPAKISDFNLNNIRIFSDRFDCPIGLSDHSKDDLVAFSAVSAGAKIIEKHIALKNQTKGLDIKFSIKGNQIKRFSKSINMAKKLLGSKKFKRDKSENINRKLRRSIFIVKDIKRGENFTKNNIKKIRPGFGVGPIYYDKILKKKSPANLKKEIPFSKNLLKKLKIKI
mgnify:CR=1 FL=1